MKKQIQSTLKKSVHIPTKILFFKGLAKVQHKIATAPLRQKDKIHSSFTKVSVLQSLPIFFKSVPLSDLQNHKKTVLGQAQEIISHRFDLLGSTPTQVYRGMYAKGFESKIYAPSPKVTPDVSGTWLNDVVNKANLKTSQTIWNLVSPEYLPIDWQIDFKSGYRWSEKTWYQDIRWGKPGADIKMPWELARMQHLPTLAWAYALNENKNQYSNEFRNQILDFIATNPPRFGVNWKCTMDVAIRVVNWLVTYDLFRGTGCEFDESFNYYFKKSIFEHGLHIFNNLEWNKGTRNNHYLANLAGLVFVGAYLQFNSIARKWLGFAKENFLSEVMIQFNPDGSNFEASTAYHHLSGQMVAYTTALLTSLPNSKSDFSKTFINQLFNMSQFSKDLKKPSGALPQIGDNDSGHFLRLDPRGQNSLQHDSLVSVIESFFQDHPTETFESKLVKTSFDLPVFSSFVPKSVHIKHSTISRNIKTSAQRETFRIDAQGSSLLDGISRKAYPDFGVYLFRSPRLYLLVRCGAIGQGGLGGHAHHDQLMVELSIDGKDIWVDPGSYIYTASPTKRNQYRSIQSHYAPRVSHDKKGLLEPGDLNLGLFLLKNSARATCLQFDDDYFLGCHDGYTKRIFRSVRIEPQSILITDEFLGSPHKDGVLVPINRPILTSFSSGYGEIN